MPRRRQLLFEIAGLPLKPANASRRRLETGAGLQERGNSRALAYPAVGRVALEQILELSRNSRVDNFCRHR